MIRDGRFEGVTGALVTGLLILGCGAPSGDRESIQNVGSVDQPLCAYNDAVDVEPFYSPYEATGIGETFVDTNRVPVGMLVAQGSDEVHCGASLINDDVVLTAGHCVNPPVPERVVFGYRTDEDYEGFWAGTSYDVDSVLGYENTATADWALLKLDWSGSQSPGDKYGTVRLVTRAPEVGEWLTAIGYPELKAPANCSGSGCVTSNGLAVFNLEKLLMAPVVPPPSNGGTDWTKATFFQVQWKPRAGFSGGAVFAERRGHSQANLVGIISRTSPGCSSTSGSSSFRVSQMPSRWAAKGISSSLINLIKTEAQNGCITASLPSAQKVSAGSQNQFYSATSPSGTGSYGLDGCPYNWVVQVSNVAGKSFRPAVEPASTPSSCAGYTMTLVAKGYNPSTASWVTLASERKVGKSGSPCQWDTLTNSVSPTFSGSSHPYTKVRLAARFEKNNPTLQNGPQLRSVKAGVTISNGGSGAACDDNADCSGSYDCCNGSSNCSGQSSCQCHLACD